METDNFSGAYQNDSVFDRQLLTGEHIVWREDGKIINRNVMLVFSVFWLACSLLFTIAGYHSGGIVFALFGIPLIAIGVSLLVLSRRKLPPFQYALTNMRLLICHNKKFTEIKLEKIVKIDVECAHRGTSNLKICENRFVNGVGEVPTVICRIRDMTDPEGVRSLILTERDKCIQSAQL